MYRCIYCHTTGEHDFRCPNYEPPIPKYICSKCNEGIFNDEEFVINEQGERRHINCFDTFCDLAEWLGHFVYTMKDYY